MMEKKLFRLHFQNHNNWGLHFGDYFLRGILVFVGRTASLRSHCSKGLIIFALA